MKIQQYSLENPGALDMIVETPRNSILIPVPGREDRTFLIVMADDGTLTINTSDSSMALTPWAADSIKIRHED